MLLSQFEYRFPTEDSCIDYFKDVRSKALGACPKCGHTEYYWLRGKQAFECKFCRHRTPLTKGTVMEHSKLPMRTWFYTMHLMTSIKQVLSAKEVQHQLHMPEYPPVWLMMMKLRNIMGKRESIYKLSGTVELDEAFFPTRMEADEKAEPMKRGAGSQRQSKVLVIVESKAVDDILRAYLESKDIPTAMDKAAKLTKRSKRQSVKKVVHYIKMFAIDDLKASTIDELLAQNVDAKAIILSDGSSSHVNLDKNFAKHIPIVEKGNVDEVVKKGLPWVHIIIGECRNGIAAIHKEIDGRFLQLYLNEYCWKFNRRFFRDSNDPKYDLFDRLVRISALYTSDVKWRDYTPEIEDKEDL